MKYHTLLMLLCLSIFPYPQDNVKAAQFPLAASYSIDNSWPTGYQVTITLKNNSLNSTSSWMSSFTLGQGQSVSNLWNGVVKSNGQTVTVANPTWYGGVTI